MLTKEQIISLAYFDGTSLEQIAEKGLSSDDLRRLAGQCGQWAYQSARPSSRSQYLERAERFAKMAEGAESVERITEWNPNPAQGWPAR